MEHASRYQEDDGGLMGKNPVQALRDWFGERGALRRSYGHVGLTRAVDLCDEYVYQFNEEKQLAEDTIKELENQLKELKVGLAEIQKKGISDHDEYKEHTKMYNLEIQEIRQEIAERKEWKRIAEQYAELFKTRKINLTDGASGDGGWDTQRAIEAAEAVTPKTNMKMEKKE